MSRAGCHTLKAFRDLSPIAPNGMERTWRRVGDRPGGTASVFGGVGRGYEDGGGGGEGGGETGLSEGSLQQSREEEKERVRTSDMARKM